MKTKLITTLTALLMLVGIGAQAQTDNQTPSSAESTDLEGDLNHDGKVDVADVTYLVNIILKNKPLEGCFWYLSNEALTEDNAPHDPAAQDAEDHKGWRELDPNTTRLEVPYVEMEDRSNVNWCIAVPAALGFTKIVNTGDMDVTNGFEHSNITVNNVEYDVWTVIVPVWRISRFYLIK